MSIAWGIVEYLHKCGKRPKTLFATHYHELNELENLYERVRNYHISVKEVDKNVIFLRKLERGGVAHSFGIHVARLAGMPREVINFAERKLNRLENEQGDGGGKGRQKENRMDLQLSLFQLDDPLLLEIKEQLREIDLNKMSPLDAFDTLRALKKKIGAD